MEPTPRNPSELCPYAAAAIVLSDGIHCYCNIVSTCTRARNRMEYREVDGLRAPASDGACRAVRFYSSTFSTLEIINRCAYGTLARLAAPAGVTEYLTALCVFPRYAATSSTVPMQRNVSPRYALNRSKQTPTGRILYVILYVIQPVESTVIDMCYRRCSSHASPHR